MTGETDVASLAADADTIVAGVDEAGRGPLAGPVVAAAVVLSAAYPIDGLADSKTLSALRREALAVQIRAHAAAWALGMASVEEIDRLNILGDPAGDAARGAGPVDADLVLVDGNRAPRLSAQYARWCGDARLNPFPPLPFWPRSRAMPSC